VGIDVKDVNDLSDIRPLWQRVREVVRHGPQTIAVVAHELNYANVESLDRIVRRQKNVFTKTTGPDGIQRIALVERRAS
jgi:ABC-type enterochelin transport system ATPase subunit